MRKLLATAKAFSDPTRVRVILALLGEELCVCELCDALDLVQSTLSTHLQFLRQAGLARTRNDGKWVYYQLTKEFVRTAHALSKLHLAELEADPQLRADAARLKQRLALRDEGSCCLGFATKSVTRRKPRRALTAARK